MHKLTVADLNPAVLNVQYAVRGELAIKAEDLRNKLEAGHQLPFKRVINSNIGNPQQKGLDQPPITFTRQVRSKPNSTADARLPSRMLHRSLSDLATSGCRAAGVPCPHGLGTSRFPKGCDCACEGTI